MREGWGLSKETKEEAGERLEGHKDCGLGVGGKSGLSGRAESCSYMEKSLHCGNSWLTIDHNHLTGNDHVVGRRTAYVPDRRVANARKPNGGSYGAEMKGKECIVGTSLKASPRLCGGAERAGVFGRGVPEPGRHELRKEIGRAHV